MCNAAVAEGLPAAPLHWSHGFHLRGLRIAVDCAHGATYHIAPSVLEELGADLITMGADPDGFNINRGVGSTDIGALAELVVAEQACIHIDTSKVSECNTALGDLESRLTKP